jgi:hypothetical protein
MATNSFLFKGWAITIASALSAFAAVDRKRTLLAIAVASTMLFWGLDGYYLWLERGFIELHKKVAAKPEAEVDFSMAIEKGRVPWSWLKTCSRPHLWSFYLSIIAIDIAAILATRGK